MPQDLSPGHDEPAAAREAENGESSPRAEKRAQHKPRLALKLPLLALALLALFAGQLVASAWSAQYDLLYDEASHLSLARSLVESRGYGFVGTAGADAFRPPLVPALYAALFAFTGPSLLAARLLSAIFAIAAALLLGALARKLWGPAFFLPTAVLMAATPLVWFYATKAMTETAVLFLVSAFLYALFSARENPRWLLLAVPTLSLLFLAKYPALLFALFFALFLVAYQRSWLRSRFLPIGIALALLVLVPWFALNLALSGNPISAAQTHLASSSGFAASIDPYYFSWGLPVLLAAFIPLVAYGLFSLARGRNPAHRQLLITILLLAVLFLASLSALEVKRDRYLIPILPGLLLAAAWGSFRFRARLPRLAPWLLALLILINLVVVPYGLLNYPKADRFTALAAAGPTLHDQCAQSPIITTNVYPYAFWFTSRPTQPMENFTNATAQAGAPASNSSGCILLDSSVKQYPELEPLLAQRSLLFKQGDIRVYG